MRRARMALPPTLQPELNCRIARFWADRSAASMARACGRLSGGSGAVRGGAAQGPEDADLRVFDQVHDTREEVVVALALPDVDDRGVGQQVLEHPQYPFAHMLLEGIEGLVDDDPAWLVQGQAREDHALLIVVAEFPVPAGFLVERRRQLVQAAALERGDELAIF